MLFFDIKFQRFFNTSKWSLILQSIQGSILVSNYPLLPLPEEHVQALEKALAERKLQLEIEDYSDHLSSIPIDTLPTPRSAGVESPQPGRMTPMSFSRNTASADSHGRSVKGSGDTRGGSPEKFESERKYRFMGSQSHKFIDIEECCLIDQRDVTTKIQTEVQILLIQVSGNFKISFKYCKVIN